MAEAWVSAALEAEAATGVEDAAERHPREVRQAGLLAVLTREKIEHWAQVIDPEKQANE